MGKSVSYRVQELLDSSHFGDDELAEKLSVSRTTVWRWRTGKVEKFSSHQLQEIAKLFHVSYRWLKSGEGEKEVKTNTQNKADEVRQLMAEYESRKASRNVSDIERDILLEFLREQAESLAKGLRHLQKMKDVDPEPDDKKHS